MSVEAFAVFGFTLMKRASDMTAVEDPIHRVAGKDVGDLLFGGEHNKRRLQQSGANFAAAWPLPKRRPCAARWVGVGGDRSRREASQRRASGPGR